MPYTYHFIVIKGDVRQVMNFEVQEPLTLDNFREAGRLVGQHLEADEVHYELLDNCSLCPFVFTGQVGLAMHAARIHPICQQCGRQCANQRGLATHSRVHSRPGRVNRNREIVQLPFRCCFCPRTFATERGRNRHCQMAARKEQRAQQPLQNRQQPL